VPLLTQPQEYATPWSHFVEALWTDPSYHFILSDTHAEAMLDDLLLHVDNYKTGYVVCHRLSDFVGDKSLFVALQNYKNKRMCERNSDVLVGFWIFYLNLFNLYFI
jgi:hypothetical protein